MPRISAVNLSIDVPDLEAGILFYKLVFGFLETSRPLPIMAVLDAGNLSICLHEKAQGSHSSASSTDLRRYDRHWTPVHLDIHLEDFESCLKSIKRAGGAVESVYRTQAPRSVAFCSDPFGNGFCVLGPG
ncbi:VOC family protein [Qipengyuania proteolytica]|uniref:VOC family protein n=1 Tax=Qipengyuania proteolytica TaxID=2867239 RepID=UPI003CD0CCF1